MVVLTELFVGFYKNNEILEKTEFLSALHFNKNFKIIDYNLKIADKAAKIRSKTNLRLPDCIIIASALHENTDILISNDSDFKKIENYLEIYNFQEFYESFIFCD
ncbi:MAG: PIN domain-containing protein [Candidatus Lokiarchaeota archaeon]|nr:PIN domain-containing protein [Candidatus Lokiarchaeota archaeon]MBD3200922.1 PIN domain-containing protein [Candidatus Lokiarchaeota archaeon]